MSGTVQGVRGWIEAHPYLADLAALEEGIESAGTVPERVRDPRSSEEIASGVPVLRSEALDPAVFTEAGKRIVALAEALLEAPLPPALVLECRTLCVLLGENPEAGTRLARSVAASDAEAPAGLATFLAWKALGGVVPAAANDGWTASCCPGCGALPAMAQLRESDRGRERHLVCGLCGTSWRYARIGCPFCRNETVERLGVLEPEGEESFRVDFCRECNSYLKTYVGSGGESLALSDWSTLHLDAACAERGLRRGGPSLYDL